MSGSFSRASGPVALASLGWALLCAGLAWRFGPWLFVAGIGLGALVAGLFVQARDAVAAWIVAYLSEAAGVEGSTSKLQQS